MSPTPNPFRYRRSRRTAPGKGHYPAAAWITQTWVHLRAKPSKDVVAGVAAVHLDIGPSRTELIPVTRRRRCVLDRPALEGLARREIDILRLVAEGLSNTEIAQRLFLRESTIKTHVGRVLGKTNARDRVQAVVLACETGLVEPGAKQ